MTVQSNPRKLYQSGNGTVASFPNKILEEAGLERGDQIVMTAEDGAVTIEPVEWEVTA